jgi:hypothetical protein
MKLLSFLVLALSAVAQTAAPKAPAGRVIGAVTAKDPAGKQLTVKTDAGVDYTVNLDDKTAFLRVAPGETDLKKAARIASDDVKVGDRVMARGTVAEEQKSIPAITVIVMTKEDLAQKQQREQAEWQTRGAAGVVKSVNPDSKEVVISAPAREGAAPLITIATGANSKIRRYAPESVKFADAKTAALTDIQPGDHARVRGEKSADGTRIEAEDLVFGTFRTIAGTVLSVDAANNEIKINDLQTKKPVTIKLNVDSQLKKLPPMAATMLARRLNPTFQGGPGGAAGVGARPGGAGPGGAGPGGAAAGAQPGARRGGGSESGQPGLASGVQDAAQRGGPGGAAGPGGAGWGDRQRMGGGGGNIEQMLERMPAFTLAEVQPGEPLIVSTTARAGALIASGLTVLSGVEPILRAAPAGQGVNLGSWSLDLNMPAQ